MSSPVIVVEDLGKKYRIRHRSGERRYVALRDVIADGVAAGLRSLKGAAASGTSTSVEDFWALKDVSFEVPRGQVLGIVGRNGAGKSTLLKILSRITEPTEGRVRIKGRVASLLEVGTGFHPELTGRENIFLNGAVLGMTRAEIARKFDEIVAFAELDKFLDTPVKRYSSGMYVRLAFAVAAHLEPEILIVDEVLAVGDAEFQRKCLGKMEGVARGEGRTVLFVSHNMAAVEGLCRSAILLSGGRVAARGGAQAIVQEYLSDASRPVSTPLTARTDRQGSGDARITSLSIAGDSDQGVPAFRTGAASVVVLGIENRSGRELRNFRVAVGVDTERGQRVLLLDSELLGVNLQTITPGGGVVRIRMPRLCLLPGRYNVSVYTTANGILADWIMGAGSFDVEGGDYFGSGQQQTEGLVATEHSFEFEPVRS